MIFFIKTVKEDEKFVNQIKSGTNCLTTNYLIRLRKHMIKFISGRGKGISSI